MSLRTNARILHFACGILFASASASASESQPELLWSYEMPNETYSNYAVSLGDGGAQVFTDTGKYTRFTRLFSSMRPNGAAPEWELSDPTNAYSQQVASADEGDRHFSLWQELDASGSADRYAKLAAYTSQDAQPDWTREFSVPMPSHDRMLLACSADGSTVAVVIQDIYTSTEHVWIFDGVSGQQTNQFEADMVGWFSFGRLSRDGSTLYLNSLSRMKVFNTQSGTELFSDILFGGTYTGHGISHDGDVIALSLGNGAQVYARSDFGGYVEGSSYDGSINEYVNALAVSPDGELLALGFSDGILNRARIRIVRLSTGAVLLDRTYQGAALAEPLWPRELEFSGNGDRLAAVMTGDGVSTTNTPEVVVFERTTRGQVSSNFQVQAAWERTGSRMELDLSDDGNYLVVCGRETHASSGSGDKVIELYHLGADLLLSGSPEAGGSIEVEFRAETAPMGFALITTEALSTPMQTTAGPLWLDRSVGLDIVRLNDVDAFGISRGTVSLDGYAPGTRLFFQAYSAGPRRLSISHQGLTVLP